MNDQYYYWKCVHCGNVHCSDTTKRHRMDFCQCGESAIDAEELYIRGMGYTEQITEEEYNILLTKNKQKDA